MSELQHEADVAQKKRRDKKLPPETKVSVRDQIPKNLAAKLREEKVGEKIVNMWMMGNANRQNWIDRQQTFLANWDEFLEPTAEGAFNIADNLHVPMPLIVAKTMHARFLEAIVGVEPFFTVKPRREDAVERSKLVTNVMHYNLKDWCNEYEGIFPTMDKWVWDWITVGDAFLKVRWDTKYTSFMDVTAEIEATDVEVVEDQNGNQLLRPSQTVRDVEVRRVKKTFDGIVYEAKQFEDVIVIGGGGDPQKADGVLDRFFLTASELWSLADRGVFDRAVVKDIIDKGPDSKSGLGTSNVKDQRAQIAGISSVDTNLDLDRYEIIEAYLKFDVEGSGITSEIVVWSTMRKGDILRATYLHRINKNGKRPYFRNRFHLRQGTEFGTGLIEMLHPLSKEIDFFHNLRIDSGLISTMPFGFIRASNMLDKETLKIMPGHLIPVDNPQTDIVFPNLGNRTLFGFQEEQALNTLVERLTGISDIQLGAISGKQGASRTATGARALINESNTNLNVFLRRFQHGWRQALKFSLDLLQQRIPEGLSFRVTGETGNDYWSSVRNREDIQGDFDFEIDPNSASSNPVIKQEITQAVFQMTQNPLLIQLQIVTPANMYESAKDVMKGLGVKDFGRFLTPPADKQTFLSPKDEMGRIVSGIAVEVVPAQDHQAFIDLAEEVLGSDELLGLVDEPQTQAIVRQVAQHRQMQKALQDAEAQARNIQQVQLNSQLATQQGGGGAPAGGNVAPGGQGPGLPQNPEA